MQPTKDSEKMQNFCGISLDNLDFNLVEATLASIETRSLTPIIKEELKLKIQSQRLAAGKSELPKSIFKEPEKCELTQEEVLKRDHRRERNRVAAAKCRDKRKSQSEKVKTSLAEEELRNYTLKRRIEELENEKRQMIKKLKLEQITLEIPPEQTQQQQQQQQLSICSPISSPSPCPVSTQSTHLPPNQTALCNMPSTSAGMSRRYSDELPRNLGALNYIPRRSSADSCKYFCTYNAQQNETVATETVPQTSQTEYLFPHIHNDNHLTNIKTFQRSENEISSLEDLELDILSDDEFFRFENETIPFEQYQNASMSHISPPSTGTGEMIATDGSSVKVHKGEDDSVCAEKPADIEGHRKYLISLIPVFEDDAMVPEGNDTDRFTLSPGPTSPTFY